MDMYDVVNKAMNVLLSGAGHNRYHLSISGCLHSIDVKDFIGQECLSTPFSYQIRFTSVIPNITPQEVLNHSAKFYFQNPSDLEIQRRVYGVITSFSKLSTSKDQTLYTLTLEPRIALLRKTQYTSIFQNQSIPQIVDKILRDRHGFEGQDFHFDIAHTYPSHEQDMQYKETDYDFIARKLAWDGIWYRFDMDTRLDIDVVVFSDDQTKYVFGNKLPIYSPAGSGMNGNDTLSVWGLSVHHQVVQAGAKVKDYNYRTANATQNSQTDDWQPDQTTYGVPYHYGDRYLQRGTDIDPEIETGSFHARLHNERYKNNQIKITGFTNDPSLYPGKVLDLEEGSTTEPALKGGFLIISTSNKGSRSGKYEMRFEAIPYSDQVGFRPPLLDRPHIAGTIPARVSSTEKFDTYSHIDEMGRYKVQFDFDLDTWDKGKESLWVRLAKPYSGDTYGFHCPLLDGTEVAIAFEDGDPDRPYIAYALHDSTNGDHVTIQNYKRNILRTPANNKIRMEDERGKEHIKLSTEYGGKTQLNMGHLVDSSRQKRGEGFELRTDKWGALRAGQGLFISTEARATASSTQLDMKEATSQLQSAQQLVESLRAAAELAKAELADLQTQKKLLDENINELKKSGILMSAPAGIAQTTPESIELAAGKNVITAASGNHDTSILGKITMAAGKCISLFAQSTGIKIFASKGKVQVQAQGDEMDIEALKDITMKSSTGKVLIAAKQEIILTAGSAYIRIGNSQVEIGAPDHIILKTAVVQKQGAASMNVPFNNWKQLNSKYNLRYRFLDPDGNPQINKDFVIYKADGSIHKAGKTDAQGYTPSSYFEEPEQLTAHLKDDLKEG